MGKNHVLTSVLAVSALAFSLVSCTGAKPSPDDAAAALAQGLGSADVSGSAFTAGTAAQVNTELETLLAGMGTLRPTVTVAGVEEDPATTDAATATLSYSWDLNADSAPDWTYTTTADLQRGAEDAWLVQWTPQLIHENLGDGDRLETSTYQSLRAGILDRNGQPLVQARQVLRIGLDKSALSEAGYASSAAALAELAGLDPAAYTAQVQAAGPEAFVEALVQRAEADGPATPEALAAIPGALSVPDTRELAPTRTFARALLGTVGEATAELIEDSGNRLSAGDMTGLSGLQQQYDQQLGGAHGVRVSARSTAGVRSLFSADATTGTPLQTTLDPRLQTLAEGILEDEPSASAIVAIQPSTGDVLTVANGPGSEGQQTALLGQYPPGSTFKIATSLALLRQGTTPDTLLSCPAELTVDGRKFNNASSYPAAFEGEIPLRDAFSQSCNTAFINTRDTVPQSALAAAAADLGIGVAASMGVPAFFGAVPAEATGTAHAASMIGQGEILVSPLALAVAAASVGHGQRVTPSLVNRGSVQDPAGSGSSISASPTPSGSPSPEAAGASPAPGALSAAEAASLRGLMRGVVTAGGASMLQNIPGEPVLAKTGTAEFGSETPPRTHAWVVALQGDLAVAVFVAEGELGSTSGGPLMKAFLEGAAG